METLVYQELEAWRAGRVAVPEVLCWRTAAGAEADFIVELPSAVVPIEIKAGEKPRLDDLRHLTVFLDEHRRHAPHGILLHTGTRCERLGERVWVVPLSAALV